MYQQVEITISQDGKAQIKVINGGGVNCVSLTQKLEEDLGEIMGDRSLLPEYNNQSQSEDLWNKQQQQ